MGTCTGTGLPFHVAGLNFHLRTTSIAFSYKPRPGLLVTWMLSALPSLVTTTRRTTTPSYFFFFASLEYSGSGQYSHRGMPTPLTPARKISVFDLSSAGCCAMAAKPTNRKSGASPRKRRCREDRQEFMERSVSWRAFKKESFLGGGILPRRPPLELT